MMNSTLLYTDTSEGVVMIVLPCMMNSTVLLCACCYDCIGDRCLQYSASRFPRPIVDRTNRQANNANHPSPLSPVVASPFKSAWKRGDGKYAK